MKESLSSDEDKSGDINPVDTTMGDGLKELLELAESIRVTTFCGLVQAPVTRKLTLI